MGLSGAATGAVSGAGAGASFGPWGAAIGGVAGGLIGAFGQEDQNSANAAQSRASMDFEYRMANTAYQRSTEDMKAAGLNPLMMYGSGSSAATPPGQQAQMGNVGASAVSSAGEGIAIGQAAQQAALTDAQIKKTEADAAGQDIHNIKDGSTSSIYKTGTKALEGIVNTVKKKYDSGSSALQNFLSGGADNSPAARAQRVKDIQNEQRNNMKYKDPGQHPSNTGDSQ